jgi:hypothetical protein
MLHQKSAQGAAPQDREEMTLFRSSKVCSLVRVIGILRKMLMSMRVRA